MWQKRYYRIKRDNLRGTARESVETKMQSSQVNGSAAGRNDVGSNLLQRHDITSLGYRHTTQQNCGCYTEHCHKETNGCFQYWKVCFHRSTSRIAKCDRTWVADCVASTKTEWLLCSLVAVQGRLARLRGAGRRTLLDWR